MVVLDTVGEPALGQVGVRVFCEVVLLEVRVDAVEVGHDAIFGHAVFLGEEEPARGAVLDAAADFFNLHAGNAVGERLDVGVDGGVDGNAVGIEGILSVLLFHVLADFFVEVQARTAFFFFLVQRDGSLYVLVVVFLADVAGIVHRVEYGVAAFEASFRVAVGAVGLRTLEHARQHGVFRNRETVERVAEVESSRGLETVVAAGEVHFVHVEFENLFLGVRLLDADGRHRFLDFTGDGTFGREEEQLGELLCERRCTAELFAAGGAFQNGRRNGPHVHAPVAEERAVFGGHHGMDGVYGNRIVGNPFAALHVVLVGDFPVHVVDVRDKFRVDLLQLRERGELRREMDVGGEDGDDSRDDGNTENDEPLDDFFVGEKIADETEAGG